MKMGLQHADSLKIACDLYNQRHRAWLKLHRKSKGRSLIIRYEKLLEEPREVLDLLARTFGLQRFGPEPVFIAQRTGPTHWDDHPITFESVRFNPNTYRDRDYQQQLSEEMWASVREKIDWNLAAEFGYNKLHFRR
jgi:hypothetical protein